MQRRAATSRPTPSRHSSSSSTTDGFDANDKRKRRKVPPALIFFAGCFLLSLVVVPMLLTPSEKKEIIDMEHRVEEWLNPKNDEQHEPEQQQPSKKEGVPTEAERDLESGSEHEDKPAEDPPSMDNRASSDAATARMEAQSSRWVDGEKRLKELLTPLYEMQKKGKHLGVPVLTRYLGEDVPAYIGTPDSAMNEAEWRKLVEAKYEEMRVEEEAWKKKMAAHIATREREIGVTTA